MSSIAAKHHHGDFQLQEEEKLPFITPAFRQVESTSDSFPSERQEQSGKMSPRRRFTLIFTISLLVGLGVALARNPSLTTTCIRWSHGPHRGPSSMARTALNKRQDGSLTNITTPGSSVDQSKTPATPERSSVPVVVPSSSPPLPVVPAPSTTPTPPLPPSEATPTSASTKPQQPVLPPSPSTTPPTGQLPPSSLPVSTPPSQIETSRARNPESSVQVSTSSRSTKAVPSSNIGITSSPFHHDIIPTNTPFQKTITTGHVLTSSPVARIWTTTLENGGVLTITSTSWVAIVPTEKPTSSSEPKLQNVAPKLQGGSKLVLAAGVATLGMLFL
ncbi:hypothetical protein E4U53_004516 [Claviceps sorghi]|nr:hypothetical protein E4U53_004516 [Claviceps sorghi]